jgi:hypothetical protein
LPGPLVDPLGHVKTESLSKEVEVDDVSTSLATYKVELGNPVNVYEDNTELVKL